VCDKRTLRKLIPVSHHSDQQKRNEESSGERGHVVQAARGFRFSGEPSSRLPEPPKLVHCSLAKEHLSSDGGIIPHRRPRVPSSLLHFAVKRSANKAKTPAYQKSGGRDERTDDRSPWSELGGSSPRRPRHGRDPTSLFLEIPANSSTAVDLTIGCRSYIG
jgi:hypothetical protein